jgi:hypothetical protein
MLAVQAGVVQIAVGMGRSLCSPFWVMGISLGAIDAGSAVSTGL